VTCVPIPNGFICVPPRGQPMTRIARRLTIDDVETNWVEEHGRGEIFWCYECRKKRRAENLTVIAQEWYDDMIFCSEGKGCNGPETKRGTRRKRWKP
jgi:hypothetical protein